MITGDLIKQGLSAFGENNRTSNTYTIPIEFTALDSESTVEEVLSILGGDLEAETLIDNLNADKTASLCFQNTSSLDSAYGAQKHIDTTSPLNYVSDFMDIYDGGFPSTKSLEVSFIDPYYIPSERSIRIKTMKVSLKSTPSSVEGEPDTREWDYSYSELASFYHSGIIPQIARLPMTLLTLENGLTSEELLTHINPNNDLQDTVENIVLSLNGSFATGTLTYPLVIFMSQDSKTIPFTYTNCTDVDWDNKDSFHRPTPFYPCHLELEYTHENTHFRGVFDKETASSDWVYNVERTSIGDSTYIIPSNVLNLENYFTSEQIITIFGSEQNILDMLSELNSGTKTPLIYANMGGTNRWCQYPHDVYSDGATYLSLLITSLGGLEEPTTRRYELKNTAGEWKATVTEISSSSEVTPSDNTYAIPSSILNIDKIEVEDGEVDPSMTEVLELLGGDESLKALIENLSKENSNLVLQETLSGSSNQNIKFSLLSYKASTISTFVYNLEMSVIDTDFSGLNKIRMVNIIIRFYENKWEWERENIDTFNYTTNIPNRIILYPKFLSLENGLTSEELITFLTGKATHNSDPLESLVWSLNNINPSDNIFVIRDGNTQVSATVKSTNLDYETPPSQSGFLYPLYPCTFNIEYILDNVYFKGEFTKPSSDGEWTYNVERTLVGGESGSDAYIIPQAFLSVDESLTSEQIIASFGSEQNITSMIEHLGKNDTMSLFYSQTEDLFYQTIKPFDIVSNGTTSATLIFNYVDETNNFVTKKLGIEKNTVSNEWSAFSISLGSTTEGSSENAFSFSTVFTNDAIANNKITVFHNLGSPNVSVTVYDSLNTVIIPDEVTVINSSSVEINLESFSPLLGEYRVVIFSSGASVKNIETITLEQLNSFLPTNDYYFNASSTNTLSIPEGNYFVNVKTSNDSTKTVQTLTNLSTGLSYKRLPPLENNHFISNIVEKNEVMSCYGTSEYNQMTGITETIFESSDEPWNITGTPISHWKEISLVSSTPGIVQNPKIFQYKGDIVPTEGIIYEIDPMNAETAYVVGTTPAFNVENVVIAPTYEGKPVTSIGMNAFSNKMTMLSISLPQSITTINDNSFNYCTSLESISLEHITYIGMNAFTACSRLERVDIPSTMITIRNNAFSSNFTLDLFVDMYEDNMPDTFEFGWNSGVRSTTWKTAPLNFVLSDDATYYSVAENPDYKGPVVNIPETHEGLPVRGIISNAFTGNFNITDVYIPATIEFMGENILLETVNLLSINVDLYEQPESWSPNWLVVLQDSLVVWKPSLLFTHRSQLSGEANAPTGYAVSGLAEGYTKKDIVVPTMYMGEPVTGINNGTFRNADITSIVFPESIDYIGSFSFSECASLESVTLPTTLTRIRAATFERCISLKTITIPTSITHIELGAFSYSGLTSITIPEGVVSIGYDLAQTFSSSSFDYCASLESVQLPSTLTYLGENAFAGCSKLTKVNIPAGITQLPDEMFSYCTSLAKMYIPEYVTSIGYGVFLGCSSLTEIEVPTGITELLDGTFSNCSSLVKIKIPNSVVNIQSSVFNGSEALSTGKVLTHYTKDSYPLGWLIEGVEPDTYNQSFYNATWEDYLDVTQGVAYESNGDGTASVTALPTNKSSVVIAESYRGEPVTAIAPGSLAISNYTVTSLILPETLQTIGTWSLAKTNITSIKIPKSVTYIDSSAFYESNNLGTIEIWSTTNFSDSAFHQCGGLHTVNTDASRDNLPANWTYSITNRDFFDASWLTITYGMVNGMVLNHYNDDGLILYYYFYDSGTTLDIPETAYDRNIVAIGQTSIPQEISIIKIPSTISTIEANAFSSAAGLTTVYTDYTKENYPSGWSTTGNSTLFNLDWLPLS